MVYVDSSRPNYVEGNTRNTLTAMVEGIGSDILSQVILDATFANGIAGHYRAADEDGVSWNGEPAPVKSSGLLRRFRGLRGGGVFRGRR